MTEKDFIPTGYQNNIESGKVGYKAPSNIALVKYWGKKKNQIPANPSISFTLDTCATTTWVSFAKKTDEVIEDFSFDLYFEGEVNIAFRPKINTFLERILAYLPFLKEYHFHIETSNSFPHSSGIASSASGMAALALCFMQIERLLQPAITEVYFNQKASFLARLGSGSACRSVIGSVVQWGEHKGLKDSADLYGISYPFKMHTIFSNYQDTILLVDKGEKKVSSSVGHELMHGHPFAAQRFNQAHENIETLKSVFEKGDLKEFIKIVESEALTLHGMMMTSQPYFILMKPNTLEIINRIWEYRAQSGTHVCFTLDAGANVHVLYPDNEKEQVLQFIKEELIAFCQNQQYICDRVGTGATSLKNN